ncbi:phosphopantetheinyl transferase [Leptolyngbya sp. PCC 7375]|nr:phosphopantetheinyl transferase [Leptolyngbya sp. PCC 7375]DAC80106.1 TPA_exp: PPTase [Leptolyngbya sp. PCC 7375]
MRSLTNNLAKIWVVDVSKLSGADVLRCEAVLVPAEIEQMRRFQFDLDRDAYRAAHGLARQALSSFEPDVLPQNWVFESTPYGRPEISTGYGFPPLRFNISHTRGMVTVIVVRDLDCGVDVESIGRCRNLDHLALNILAPAELATLSAVPDFERPLLFSRYWTLKEAYSKALGLGLSMPFERIAFELREGGARLLNQAGDWFFEQWLPSPNYIVTTALRSSQPIRLVRHWGFPDVSTP